MAAPTDVAMRSEYIRERRIKTFIHHDSFDIGKWTKEDDDTHHECMPPRPAFAVPHCSSTIPPVTTLSYFMDHIPTTVERSRLVPRQPLLKLGTERL